MTDTPASSPGMDVTLPVAPGAEEARPIPTLLQDEDVRRLHEIANVLYFGGHNDAHGDFLRDLATQLQTERRTPASGEAPRTSLGSALDALRAGHESGQGATLSPAGCRLVLEATIQRGLRVHPVAGEEPRSPVPEQQPVARLTVREMQEINAARSARWMAGSPGWTTLEIAGELAGEVGELANVCKKLRRSEMGVPGNKVSDEELRRQARGEMADVFIVLMLTASKLGIDLQDAVCDTFNAKSEQMGFPERLYSHPIEPPTTAEPEKK